MAEIKVIKCRDVDYETAKKEITRYFKQAGEAYPDDAAEDLELDFDLVMRITEELKKWYPEEVPMDYYEMETHFTGRRSM